MWWFDANVGCHEDGDSTALRKLTIQLPGYTAQQTLRYVHTISSVHCLALWKEFKVHSALDIEETDEHCFRL
jgi:hypothetical protein